jgi:cyclically-permuted mutarotase family protein
MRKIITLLVVGFLGLNVLAASGQELPHQSSKKNIISCSSLPDIPDSLGLAGAFAGKQGNTIIFAGGANFPKTPWQGGKKVFYDEVYVLLPDADGYRWYTNREMKLPHHLAYGVTISTEHGMILIGGTDGKKIYKKVFLIHWDATRKRIQIKQLPNLPEPLAFMAGAKLKNNIFIAGGKDAIGRNHITKAFFKFDLSDPKKGWVKLPEWPGPERVLPIAAVQNFDNRQQFFLFSGRYFKPDGSVVLLTDGYRYDPLRKKWTKLAPIAINGKKRCIMGAPSTAFGESHILVFGGDPGAELKKRVHIANEIDQLKSTKNKAAGAAKKIPLNHHINSLTSALDSLTVHASSYSRDVLAYHTITDTWVKVGRLPNPPPVTTDAIKWKDTIVIPSGEIRPGIRTPSVIRGKLTSRKSLFGSLDYAALVLYAVILIGMGFYFSKREKGTDDFFLGGKRIPWWAAGLSIYATQLSAITFIAVPAVAFATNWVIYISYFAIFLMAPVIIHFYLPFFRRLHVTSAYEYLEKRFGLNVRLFGSISYILFSLGRMSIVFFLPALTLTAIFDMNIYLAIILTGGLTIVYTAMGGIEAVVWTDVLQVIILIGGIIFSIIYIIIHVGGLAPLIHTGLANHKFKFFDFHWSFTTIATWSVLLGGFAELLGPYTTDQTVIQRYLTTKNEKSAASGIWTNGIISIPTGFLFFFLGTALYVFYKFHPGLISVGMKTDQIFPLFIGQELPAGLVGFLVAGVFSASMSSLSSGMNSVTTVITVDFIERLSVRVNEVKKLRLARWITILVGLIGTAMACLLAGFSIQSLFYLFQKIIGLVLSALAGVFILGIFTRRANAIGTLIGAIISLIVLSGVRFYTPIQFYIYPLIGIPVCVIVGFIVSLMTPGPDKNLKNLTYKTLVKPSDKPKELVHRD